MSEEAILPSAGTESREETALPIQRCENENQKENLLTKEEKNQNRKFALRRDVVNKTILRNMRRYYQRLFVDSVPGYSKRRMRDPKLYWASLRQCAADLFPERELGERDVAFYLGAVLNARAMKAVRSSSKDKREIDRVYSCMYAYSHTKMEGLFGIGAMGALFRRYWSHVEQGEGLASEDSFAKNPEVYRQALLEIKDKFGF